MMINKIVGVGMGVGLVGKGLSHEVSQGISFENNMARLKTMVYSAFSRPVKHYDQVRNKTRFETMVSIAFFSLTEKPWV